MIVNNEEEKNGLRVERVQAISRMEGYKKPIIDNNKNESKEDVKPNNGFKNLLDSQISMLNAMDEAREKARQRAMEEAKTHPEYLFR